MASIFYSWQSDQPRKITRDIIEAALKAAIDSLNAELIAAERPDEDSLELDKDTQGVPGSPDITETILRKIDEASAFVADMTPVTTMTAGNGRIKHLPNSNVLIELGYAKKALSPFRLIQVWNTALTACEPEDLPFDMRGRRGPIAFHLDETSDKHTRETAVKVLTKQISNALQLIVAELAESERVQPTWAISDPLDESIWPTENGVMLVNEPEHGSGKKQVFPAPRSFVRILPEKWVGSDDLDRHDLLLGQNSGFSWGGTVDGVLTYPGSILYDDTRKVHSITKRFEKTGELWATQTNLSAKFDGELCIRGDAIPEGWLEYLAYALPHMTNGGAAWPLRVKLGVVGINGCHWPSDSGRGRPHAALNEKFIADFVLTERSVEEVAEVILKAWTSYRKIFSLPGPSKQRQEKMKFFLSRVVGRSLESGA